MTAAQVTTNTTPQRIAVKATAAAGAYVGCIVAANYVTARYGFVPVWPGIAATAGTYFAGLALGARDVLQDAAGRKAVLLAIVVGAGLSWLLSNPALAMASAAAFGISEAADFAVYTPLRDRGWARAVVASNAVGAVIDTAVFLALSGFGLTWAHAEGQLIGKLLWATLLPVLLVTAVRGAKQRWGRCSS